MDNKKVTKFIYILIGLVICLRLVVIKPWRVLLPAQEEVPGNEKDILTVVRDYPELELLGNILASPALEGYTLSRRMETEDGANRVLYIEAIAPGRQEGEKAAMLAIYYPDDDDDLDRDKFLNSRESAFYHQLNIGRRTVYYRNFGQRHPPYMEFFLPWDGYLYSGAVQGDDQVLIAGLIRDMLAE